MDSYCNYAFDILLGAVLVCQVVEGDFQLLLSTLLSLKIGFKLFNDLLLIQSGICKSLWIRIRYLGTYFAF